MLETIVDRTFSSVPQGSVHETKVEPLRRRPREAALAAIVPVVDIRSSTIVATRARLLERFGAEVEAWWERLPDRLVELAARWELELGDAVDRGNTALVLRCRLADGRRGMLKLTSEPDLG